MAFTPENQGRARAIVARYPQSRSAILPLAHLAQDQDGWLTEEAMEEIAATASASKTWRATSPSGLRAAIASFLNKGVTPTSGW